MEQRISSIYIIVVAMLFTSLTSNAESIDLISEIQHATVIFYALTDEGTKGEKITRVDISPEIKYVLADIQPEFGYWTNINLLKAPEGLANIGNANSRTRSIENPLGVVGTIEPFGDISPNGSGLYKLGVKTTDGIKWIVMDGIVTEQISLDEEEFNINGTDYGLSINDRNPGFIYNGTHQAPSIDEISLVSPYSNSITFDVNANLEVTLRKDGLDIEESISAGTYQLVISGKTNGCFKNSKTFSYWIEKAALTITADDKEKMYGADNPEWTFNYNGFVNDENEEALSRKPTASVTGSDVGTYDIIPKGAEAANYNITYANGTLTITKAPLTIKAGEYTRKQGEENPEFTLEYEGFKNNETETVLTKKPTVTCSATKDSEPGEYEVSVSGAEAQNYEISYVAGKMIVTKADPVTVTAMSYTRVYGEGNPEFEFTAEGAALNGTPQITCEATAISPVGTYDIIISQGSVTNNNVTYVKGTLTITKAPLTIRAGEYTRKQGEENPEFTLEYEGFKNNETETVLIKKPTVTCSATKDSEPGEYEVSVSGAEAQNYDISYVTGKLTVEPNNSFDEQGAGYEILDDKSVALSNDANANGEYVVPETVEHDGVIYQVTEIAAEAFKDNTDLTQVTIPASIVSIGENAFAGCTNLQTIVIYSKEPINMSKVRTRASASSAFEGVNQETCVLYVLANCIEEYKNAEGWQDFKNIRPIGDTNGDSVINAADIVEEVNAIMGTPSQKFVRPAADINGDGVVNAADIVAMVNIIMNTQ